MPEDTRTIETTSSYYDSKILHVYDLIKISEEELAPLHIPVEDKLANTENIIENWRTLIVLHILNIPYNFFLSLTYNIQRYFAKSIGYRAPIEKLKQYLIVQPRIFKNNFVCAIRNHMYSILFRSKAKIQAVFFNIKSAIKNSGKSIIQFFKKHTAPFTLVANNFFLRAKRFAKVAQLRHIFIENVRYTTNQLYIHLKNLDSANAPKIQTRFRHLLFRVKRSFKVKTPRFWYRRPRIPASK